jgi:hypothetical protein
MVRKRFICAAGAAALVSLALTAGVVAATGGAEQSQIRRIRVYEKFGKDIAQVNLRSRKNEPGDFVVFHDPLHASKKGRKIGDIHVQCLATFNDGDLCRGVIELSGRGTISVEGLTHRISKPHVRRFAIVGGTGEFRGARGEFFSEKATDSGAGLRFTILLL